MQVGELSEVTVHGVGWDACLRVHQWFGCFDGESLISIAWGRVEDKYDVTIGRVRVTLPNTHRRCPPLWEIAELLQEFDE